MQRLVNLIASSMIAAGAAMFVLGVGSVMADELPPPGSLAPDCTGCLAVVKAGQTTECWVKGEMGCKVKLCSKDTTPGITGGCGTDNGGCNCTYNPNSTPPACNCIPES